MFELPGAKRIRREEILSRTSSSPSPSPPPDSSFQDGYQRLGKLLNFDTTTTTTSENREATAQGAHQKQNAENGDEDEEQEFEFRLFSAPVARKLTTDTAEYTEETGQDNNSNGGTQKLRIRVRSPTPGPVDLSEGRFVNPSRGWEYYFTTPGLLSGSKAEGDDGGESEDEDEGAALRRKQFEEVAVSGQHMLGWARLQPWPGCHLPWRVIHLKRQHTKLPPTSKDSSTSAPAVYLRDPPETPPKSCKKPGKKRRIQLRKRVTTAEKAKEAEAEKRNRKNRERKIKRRQKARETKAATVAANGGDPDAVLAGVDDDASSQGGGD